MSYRKIKSVAKTVIPSGESLSKKVLDTMQTIADVVGGTLGPGGRPVLIERQEYGYPNLVTKDGVTVYRSLGFDDPVKHAIMETARDASVRTATEAGDGTTTATVLSNAIVRFTHKFCKANPKVSPQRVVRILEKIFNSYIEPEVKREAITAPSDEMLFAVAKCSANGDEELATAIMKCFDLAGDEGNITIVERSGPSTYEVELLKGYPVTVGYEDSCKRFFPTFINDRVNNRIYLEKPVFVLNFGSITEIQQLYTIMGDLGADLETWLAKQEGEQPPKNVVVVATEFSENVLGHLAKNFSNPETLNIVPLQIPKFPIQSGQLDFLHDLQAVTGATLFDPIRRPLKLGRKEDVGAPLEYFEMTRYRTNIVGIANESDLLDRVEEIKAQIDGGAYESELEKSYLLERLGKLTGGIAKLTVVGASNGEIREKKDRAEDAACAIRGALKAGCLPGGCWTFMLLKKKLMQRYWEENLETQIVKSVLIPSLEEPLTKLLSNCGYSEEEIKDIHHYYMINFLKLGHQTYDAVEGKFTSAIESGVMDSVPAVLEALRNSISIASLLGTLSGVVVFPRDPQLERQEATDTYSFLRDANTSSEE